MNEDELLKSFRAITDHVSHKTESHNQTNGTTARSLDPSFSSQPTGSKWTLDALSQNIRAALHIDPVNTGAIKDIISLPIHDQLTLLSAITERYVTSTLYTLHF